MVLLSGALAGCAGSTGVADAPVRLLGPSSEFHGTWLERPIPEPDVTLTDTSGGPFDLRRETAGRLTLVYFGYTHCPDVCPTTMADLASALRDMPKADRAEIQVVFITTDPERDTPAVLRSWLASFDTSFVGLTGDYATIRAAAKSVGIALQEPASKKGDYEVTHGAEVIAFDGAHQGHLVFTSGMSSSEYAADLHRLLGTVPLAATPPVGDATVSGLRVTDAYVPQPASPDVAAGYFTVTDSGDRPAVLTGVDADVSPTASIHENTGTSMRRLRSVTVPAHGSLVFSPGGYHLMIESPGRKLRSGDHVRLTLTFGEAGRITVDAPVTPVGYRPPVRSR
ncbi:hypothetical protein MPTA5024_27940 [Microbispora sp. ATCC PTA-5024]|nr:hypothetical protein MPTA5024_27940 [Microbispora sp. ATCC PTA-5024]